MKTLNTVEVESVNGGWVPLAVWAGRAAYTVYRTRKAYKTAKKVTKVAQDTAAVATGTAVTGIVTYEVTRD